MRWFFAFTVLVCALASPAKADTYVVLPFFNVSKTANLDWIGESLAESVREALASEDLVALDRDSRVEAYRRLSIRPNALLTRASVIKVAETLDAEHVIYGQFELTPPTSPSTPVSKSSLQITAHILDLKRLRLGLEFNDTGSLEDLAVLQRHVPASPPVHSRKDSAHGSELRRPSSRHPCRRHRNLHSRSDEQQRRGEAPALHAGRPPRSDLLAAVFSTRQAALR